MHDHALKEYQRESLDALSRFCDEVRLALGQARRPVHDAFHAVTGRDFLDVPQMPGVSYVCVRIPTGGGKTLVAAHAVGAIAKRLGHQDRPLCLWVTPSTTIRDQTLRGLRDRAHPYHETGRVSLSLANVMKLRGRIVIMDEAHNARTKTSFDSLARMAPLAVLELTATPIQEHKPDKDIYASNVLHAVSALQLKREGMIKLPIDLESRADRLDVLSATVEKRSMLAPRAT